MTLEVSPMNGHELSDAAADACERLVQPGEAHAVLWHYGRTAGMMEPGSFVQALITAIAKADQHNRGRLAGGFGRYVAAVNLAEGRADGIARLRKIAGLGEPPARDTSTEWDGTPR